MLQHPFLIALLAVAILAGSWWFSRGAPEAGDSSPRIEPTGNADYVIRGMRVQTMGEDGRPANILRTPLLRHFAQEGTTELETPEMSISQAEGEAPWQITAAAGAVSADGKELLLAGDVTIAREATPHNRALEMQTRNLRVRPEENYAETDEAVTVVSGESRIESVGMHAWFKSPTRFKFLSQVRGRYVPD